MENRLQSPRSVSANLDILDDTEEEQRLEAEIYKTETELEGQCFGQSPRTPGLFGVDRPETSLKRVVDKLVRDNTEKERRLALLKTKLEQFQLQEASKEGGGLSFYEDELIQLKIRHDAEDYQTKQLTQLIKRDQAGILQLKGKINQLAEINRRLKAPYGKSKTSELVAINSLTTLINDRAHFLNEAEQRRKYFYTLKAHREKMRTKTADDIKLSIERISRYNIKAKVKADAEVQLKDQLLQGFSDLAVSKSLNSNLSNKIEFYCKEIGRIMTIMETSGCLLTGNAGLTDMEADSVIMCYRQMVDHELSLKHRFATLASEADKKRLDCANISLELAQLKAASQISGPITPLPTSTNIAVQDVLIKQSLNSKDIHLQDIEGMAIRVMFYVIELMGKIMLVLNLIKANTKLPEEVLYLIDSFNSTIKRLKLDLKTTKISERTTRRRSTSLSYGSQTRRDLFKTEINHVACVAISPISIAKLRTLVTRGSPTLASEFDSMVGGLKSSKIFMHFLEETKVTELLEQGISLKDFPAEGLKAAHSAYCQMLKAVIQTYLELHNQLSFKADLLKTSIEKSVGVHLHKKRREDGLCLQISASIPILRLGTTKFAQKSSSRFQSLTAETLTEANVDAQDLNSLDEKLASTQRQIKQLTLISPVKKPDRLLKKSLKTPPKLSSRSRLSSLTTSLKLEIRTYNSKLSEFNLCQKRLVSSPLSEIGQSPRPKFMRLASIFDRKRTNSSVGFNPLVSP